MYQDAAHREDCRQAHVQRLRAALVEDQEGDMLPWAPELMDQLTHEAEETHDRGETPDPDVCP